MSNLNDNFQIIINYSRTQMSRFDYWEFFNFGIHYIRYSFFEIYFVRRSSFRVNFIARSFFKNSVKRGEQQ